MDARGSSPRGEEIETEPLILSPSFVRQDEEEFEAVKNETPQEFSLTIYLSFFIVGLSMMWTW
jgi:hypothetical protein